jgi:tetratricopeptide (TPR) repeat protein
VTVAQRRADRGRRARSLRILVLSASIGAELLQPAARAQMDKDLARQQWEEGTADYALGHYAQAVAHYEQGYRALRDPVFLFNIGQAERLAGELERALLAYRSYLRSSAEGAPKRDIAKRWIAELETERERARASILRPPDAGAAFEAALAAPTLGARSSGVPAVSLLDAAPKPAEPRARRRWWLWGAAGVVVAGSVAAALLSSGHGGGAVAGTAGTGAVR